MSANYRFLSFENSFYFEELKVESSENFFANFL